MKQYDAVVAGYTCVDLIPNINKDNHVNNISEFLIPGKLIEIKGMDFVMGGAVPNTGMAMQKFGKKVFFNGLIGNDVIGSIAEELLRKCNAFEGMNKTNNENTAFSIVLSPPGIDRIFLEYPGCNHIFNIDNIDFQAVSNAKLFHFGYPPLLRELYINGGQQLTDLFSRIQDMGVITSLDFSLPDPDSESSRVDWSEIMHKTLPFVNIFAPSIEEMVCVMKPEKYIAIKSELPENEDIIDAIPLELIVEIGEEIIGLGVNVLLIKAGLRGIYLFTGDDANVISTQLPNKLGETWNSRKMLCKAYHAEPKKVINASGAGDTAIAAFLSAVLDGEAPETALKLASVAGRNNLYSKNIYSDLKDWNEMWEEISSVSNEIIDLSGINH